MRSFIELDPITYEQVQAAGMLMAHVVAEFGKCPATPEFYETVSRQQAMEYAKVSGTLTYGLVNLWIEAVKEYAGIVLALQDE